MPPLAELEIFHSRSIAPTRRVALGRRDLPVEPPPGFGGVLLGGVVASNVARIEPDLHSDLSRLTVQLEEGHRIAQPRLRYRFQTDRVGLARSRFRLVGEGEELSFDFDDNATPEQAVLGAVYAAGALEPSVRSRVMATVRRAMRWGGAVGPELIASLTGVGGGAYAVSAFGDPVRWALLTLGFEVADDAVVVPARRAIVERFRSQLREAHPDHGGDAEGAADRIAELSEARRILVGR